MTSTAQEIIDKHEPGMYLACYGCGTDTILWPDEYSSIEDDGRRAIGRWTTTEEDIAVLEDVGILDDWS